MKKEALIISFSQIRSDPRIQRQISILKGNYVITVVGYGQKEESSDYNLLSLPASRLIKSKIKDALLLKVGMYETFYWGRDEVKFAFEAIQDTAYDLIVANEIESLPLALKKFPRSKIWFDAHEYSPLEFSENFKWRFFFQKYRKYLCRKYLSQPVFSTTVCDSIAGLYLKTFKREMHVLTNSSFYCDLKPTNISEEKIQIVHHGAAIRSRQIEVMIDLMDWLDERFLLNLILMPNDINYIEELRRKAVGKRVRFLPPVELGKIPTYLNQFDLGIFLLKPVNVNYEYALPNKIFEFIQARLCIVVGPSVEMVKVVKKHDLGVCSTSFDPKSVADSINKLTNKEIMHFKNRSDQAANILSFEKESADILDKINSHIH